MDLSSSSPVIFLAYLATFVIFVVIFTLEVIAPASGNTCNKRWMMLAGALSAGQFVLVIFAGIIFRDLFQQIALIPLPEQIPALLVAFAVFFVSSFLAYWWHRVQHKSDYLWRVFHQLHHSPSRIEALTAFYVHPFDGLAAVLLNCAVAYLLFGASPTVAALAIMYAAAYNIYVHSDTCSARWIGVFVQRHEMHKIHHKFGHHADNYGLPIWDFLFGTIHNPTSIDFTCGFAADEERRIKDMLLLKDVAN